MVDRLFPRPAYACISDGNVYSFVMTIFGETGAPSVNEEERKAKDKFNLAVLSLEPTDTPRRIIEQKILAALERSDRIGVIAAYDELGKLPEAKETESVETFNPLPYEMSGQDLFVLRDFLAEKRLEVQRGSGLIPSSMPANREKPRFILKAPGGGAEVDLELFAASYTHGKAILLAHPEYNNGWGCAVAIGWKENRGVAEAKRIDFCGCPDVVMSALPLLKKYNIN